MSRLGITLPMETALPLSALRPMIEELPDLGYTDVWSGEAAHADAFTPLALVAAWAPALRLGTAVVPVQTRGPALLAMSAATLASAAPGGFVLGVGSSGPLFVETTNGIPFDQPYARVRDTVRFLRRALSGERVGGDFGTFRIGSFQVSVPLAARVPVMVGALRPRMLRLATREADGAIINFLTADDVAHVVKSTGEDGAGKEFVCRIFVCPTRDSSYARALGRRILAPIFGADTYSAFHRWLGRDDMVDRLLAGWADGDPDAAMRAIPDEVVDGILIHGSPEECREHVQRYVDAGVTTPVLALQPAPEVGVGPAAMRRLVRSLAAAR